MLDIVSVPEGKDLVVQSTVVPKAANVLSVQIGNLEYAPDFGVDLKYFMQEEIRFQNESFRAYLVERLTQAQINVTSVIETLERLYHQYAFSVEDTHDNTGGLIS